MNKKYFSLKLIPSRPTFAQDMTDEERGIMQLHVDYWRDLMSKGVVIVFGPVLDPAGIYGLGIVCVDSQEQVNTLTANDPASKINKYEIHPMMAIVPEK
jgi:uncharacterized protein YciI